jgi:hypothetical protein
MYKNDGRNKTLEEYPRPAGAVECFPQYVACFFFTPLTRFPRGRPAHRISRKIKSAVRGGFDLAGGIGLLGCA